jgi:hypothetical protein
MQNQTTDWKREEQPPSVCGKQVQYNLTLLLIEIVQRDDFAAALC